MDISGEAASGTLLAVEDLRAPPKGRRHDSPGPATVNRDCLLAALDRVVARIDTMLSGQVNAILHHPRFQRLEASWRGLNYLVDGVARTGGTSAGVYIRVLSVTWAELCRDFERAADFDQSCLFGKVYNEEFGMPGGKPFGLLIADYEVMHRRTPQYRTDDIAMLRAMSGVAAAAFAPFVVGGSPRLLGLERFTELGQPIDLAGTFRHPDYERWRALQDSDDSRFLGVTVPRVLMRLPYRDDGPTRHGFRFREDFSTPDSSGHLWGTAVYAFARVVARAFTATGWLADIRGTRRDRIDGGLVDDLPTPSFATETAGLALKYSTDVSIGDIQEKELADLGLIPLCKARHTEMSVFYSNQSVQTPRRRDSAVANVNARLSVMLQYILCVSRFAHYIKVMTRERVGRFETEAELRTYLQNWLHGYCIANEDASIETKARYPLREADVEIHELPSRPGDYACTIRLQPHFQLDDVATTFRLVAEISSPQPVQ
jgi:type VI secretion system protein ImpD